MFPVVAFIHEIQGMSSTKPGSEFVSKFKIHGVPLLMPILSEEESIQCRLYQKEAMLIRKELELKQKEKELEKLKSIYESASSNSSLQSQKQQEGDEWCVNILSFIVKGICDNCTSLDEFKYLFNEVSTELKQQLRDNGFLKGYTSFERSSRSPHCDSTYHDVDNVTLNQNIDEASCSGNLSHNLNFFEKDCEKNFGTLTNDTYHSEHSPRNSSNHSSNTLLLPPNDKSSSTSKELAVNVTECEDSSPRNSLSDVHEIPTDMNNQEESDIVDGLSTPPKLIRSNSYTLESPSPSVLEYLRNLCISQSSDKNEVPSVNYGLLNNYEASTPKSAVRNLNSVWESSSPSHSRLLETSNHVGVLDNGADYLVMNDKNENSVFNDGVTLTESSSVVTQALNCNTLTLKDYTLQSPFQNLDRERKNKAAITIQAAARGFLVRRLMKTFRVTEIKNTMKDALLCAWELYEEQSVTPSDLILHERLIQQVTAACYELHSIFFKWSTAERMALIRSDREKLKTPKPIFRSSRSNSESGSRSSSRSTSRSRSQSTVVAKKPEKVKSNTMKRPTTLPSIPKTSPSVSQPWSR